VLHDGRVGWPAGEHRIDDPRLRSAYLELEYGHTPDGLRRKLAEHGVDIGHDELLTWLANLAARGLVFTENDQWVAVATRSAPLKVGTAA
jgi:hypothetical protein